MAQPVLLLSGFLLAAGAFTFAVHRHDEEERGIVGLHARTQLRIARVMVPIGAVLLVIGTLLAFVDWIR